MNAVPGDFEADARVLDDCDADASRNFSHEKAVGDPVADCVAKETGNLSVAVTDRETGEVIAGAQVEARGPQCHTLITDSQGVASFTYLNAGAYRITVAKQDYTAEGRTWPAEVVARTSTGIDTSLVQIGNRELVWKCEHKIAGKPRVAKNTRLFEVVPSPSVPSGAPHPADEVQILFREDPPGGEPAKILIGGTSVLKDGTESTQHARYLAPVEYRSTPGDDIFDRSFWSDLIKPTVLPVEGLPRDCQVNAYYPHQWKLKISFPPMRTFKSGARLDQFRSGKEMKRHERLEARKAEQPRFGPAGEADQTSWRYAAGGRSRSGNAWSDEHVADEKQPDGTVVRKDTGKKMARPKAISVSRNDTERSIPTADAIDKIVSLANDLYFLIKCFQDHVPQVGFFVELEMQIFDGTLEFAAGWCEYEDHRAYLHMLLKMDMILFGIKLRGGVGVKGFSFKLQAFIEVAFKVGANFAAEKLGPGGDAEFAMGLEFNIPAACGLTFEAAYVAKFTGKLVSGVSVEGKIVIDAHEPSLRLPLKKKFLGLKGQVSGTVGIGVFTYNTSRDTTFIDSTDLEDYEWRLPAKKAKEEYNPGYTDDARLTQLLTHAFTKGWNLYVMISGTWAWRNTMTLGKTTDPETDAIAAVVQRIGRRRDILRDDKTMELLSSRIRQAIDRVSETGNWGHKITRERFLHFVRNGELDRMLDEIIDPKADLLQRVHS